MKVISSLALAGAMICTSALTTHAAPRELMQGTQIRIQLLTPINSASTKDNDPFVAIVTEPVSIGTDMLLPPGTKIHGMVTTVNHARRFSMFRGQAYLNLAFRSVEVDSRLIPIEMSIIAIRHPSSVSNGKQRKDIKVLEGQVVQQKEDVKGDIIAGAIGTGGGTLIGAVFSHATRGFGIGLAVSGAYIVSRKGREVELPAQTEFLVRMDNTITVPATVASRAHTSGR